MPSIRLALALVTLASSCTTATPDAVVPASASPAPAAAAPTAAGAATVPGTAAPGPSSAAPAASAAQPTAEVPTVALRAERSLPAGKWPEGVVVDDGIAWVAESGSRSVLRIALDGATPPQRIPVGRLPVEIVRGPAGTLLTLARTDRTVWEIDRATGRARSRWTVDDCPESMVVAGGAAWLLLWGGCTSASSSVVRIDLATGTRRRSGDLGAGAWRIGHAAERVWISGDDATVRSVRATGLDELHVAGSPRARGGASQLVAGGGGVFVASGSDVLRMDPERRAPTHAIPLGEPIAALAIDEVGGRAALLAAGTKGTVWEIDPATTTVRRRLTSPVGDAQPRSIAAWGDRLVVTDHGADGEHGRLHVLSLSTAR